MEPAAPDLSRLTIDRSAATPRRSGPLPWLLLILAVLAAAWIAYSRGWLGAPGSGPLLEVARVQRLGGAAAQSGVAANGYVVARRQAALSTDIQGRLVELPVEEGTRVRAGDLVARLDTTQYEAALARARQSAVVAEAELARALEGPPRAESEVARARAAAEFALRERARVAALVASGDERRSALDAAASAAEQAEASLGTALADARAQDAAVASAQASVEAAQAAAREIEVLIAKSSVRAPFDGVITRKNAEIGEVVSAIGATGPNARGAVATLVDFATLEVQVELAQTSLAAARAGAPVLIYLDAFPEHAYRGRVRQIWPTADRVKATVELRCVFLERDERILPEMGVRVVFVEEADGPAKPVEVLAPARALRRGAEGTSVFLWQQGAAVLRSVETGEERPGGVVRITQGLAGGELLILDPPDGLRDGDPVRRKEE